MTKISIQQQRLRQLQRQLGSSEALLLSRPSDIQYYSGFAHPFTQERMALLYVDTQQICLIIQHFLAPPRTWTAPVRFGTRPAQLVANLQALSETTGRKLLLDTSTLHVDEWQALQQCQQLQLQNYDRRHIIKQRSIKDATELRQIRRALAITKSAIRTTLAQLRVGQSELEVKQFLEIELRRQDAELAFDSIIAFDAHSAIPHHQAGHKRLSEGAVVLIDCGAKYQGYCGDVTRTVFFQTNHASQADAAIKAKKRHFQEVLRIVKRAHRAATTLLRQSDSPVSISTLDRSCRSVIEQAGYGKQFVHTTGHGLGLDIHEPPSIYFKSEGTLSPKMVITIEPGIYLEGKFGVRWEETEVV